ncbi:MAG: hypothetical protein IKQ76_05225 [Bacteroidales bacterium]|nr:hypothetical protein [Bacteroidales bacterium]
MKKFTVLTGTLISLLIGSVPAGAQAADAIQAYQQTAGTRSILFRGKQAVNYTFPFNGTPFLEDGSYMVGDITFEGNVYYGISFRINAHTQRTHVKLASTPLAVEIAPERISSIVTDGRRFEGFGPDAALPEGFYEVFGTGPERIYKLVQKDISSSLHDVNGDQIGYNDPDYRNDIYRYFSFQTFYYFRDAEGQLKRIKGMGALLRQFPERKRELRQAVKQAGYGRKRFDDACRLILNLTSR